jgi:hypothetical protein
MCYDSAPIALEKIGVEDDLAGNYLEQISRDQLPRCFVKRLQKLGLTVTVAPAA